MRTPDSSANQDESWDLIIDAKKSSNRNHFKDFFNNRDLLSLLVKRDLVTIYKQTILGPLWLLIQPVLKVAIFYFVFGKLAGISTDGVPAVLFYLTGLTFWEFFATILKKSADVFTANQHIFGKVYFPRMIAAFAAVVSSAVKLAIQFSLFFIVWIYYLVQGAISPNLFLIALPVFLLIIALLGLGGGLILSALTVKYRDLRFVIDTGLQVIFYLTPVIYPLSIAQGSFFNALLFNPLAPIIEAVRYSFLGQGVFDSMFLAYSALFAILLFWIGLKLFEKTERNFIDTI
ncbi:ABC transporter permease [Cryomorpha ignava]|uniref:Transport permease protein n=1 Tax=Cryomorpha ignava TaxID=101383 RepID=A0A7K3WRB7_9FLAO|nr:ABC transporter permease [Cryomorpha ignava]NEN24066.1 ABC transporter permease [Cryomorpha ignava]